MRIVPRSTHAAFIMPTRNRRARVLETISRIADTPGPDVEIVVADNASTDGSADEIERCFPDVPVLRMPTNRESAARNDAVGAAKSPVVVMLDDDSYPEPGALELMIDALADGRTGIAAAWVKLPGDTWEEGGAPCVHVGCGAAIPRELFLRLGGYPEIYGTYVEEYDLAFRVLAAGYDVRFVDGCVVRHEPQARSSFDFMVERLTANNVYLGWRFFPENDAHAFEEWNVYRYGVFARERGAHDGYARAIAALEEKRRAGKRDRFELSNDVLDRVMPRRIAARAFERMSVTRPISFLRAGKEIDALIAGALDVGLSIEAIYDAGLLASESQVSAIPIRPLSGAGTQSGSLVIGGLSPGFIANTRALARERGLGDVLDLCGSGA
ncbi:MAG: glycosyltransferase [Deltaproteobacteria bacterium]|nr:glycosyltransferase [Deltaproteobacteria bacterium]